MTLLQWLGLVLSSLLLVYLLFALLEPESMQ